MQITSCKNNDVNYVQIYLNQEELEKKETKEIINKFKEKKCSNFRDVS